MRVKRELRSTLNSHTLLNLTALSSWLLSSTSTSLTHGQTVSSTNSEVNLKEYTGSRDFHFGRFSLLHNLFSFLPSAPCASLFLFISLSFLHHFASSSLDILHLTNDLSKSDVAFSGHEMNESNFPFFSFIERIIHFRVIRVAFVL